MIIYFCLSNLVLVSLNESFGLNLVKNYIFVQMNDSVKIINSVSYKKNTKINYSVSVKTNRNAVLEIFSPFYQKQI